MQLVLVCDNISGNATTKCTFSQTIGTAYSESVSYGMSVSAGVEYALEAQFWTLFSESMGMSLTTGYDWTQTSDETKSEQITITVEASAPPGDKFCFAF